MNDETVLVLRPQTDPRAAQFGGCKVCGALVSALDAPRHAEEHEADRG